MKLQITPEKLDSRWRKLFPNQIPEVISVADRLEGNEIDLEGNKLTVIRLGHTDTDDTTCLHVPSIGLVLAGDAVYNGTHPFLNESNRQTRLEWIAAFDKIDALKPSAVVAGHKVPSSDDSPRNVEETRQYIRDFIRLNDTTKTARELYHMMLELYPARANPGSLWSSAAAAKAQSWGRASGNMARDRISILPRPASPRSISIREAWPHDLPAIRDPLGRRRQAPSST